MLPVSPIVSECGWHCRTSLYPVLFCPECCQCHKLFTCTPMYSETVLYRSLSPFVNAAVSRSGALLSTTATDPPGAQLLMKGTSSNCNVRIAGGVSKGETTYPVTNAHVSSRLRLAQTRNTWPTWQCIQGPGPGCVCVCSCVCVDVCVVCMCVCVCKCAWEFAMYMYVWAGVDRAGVEWAG